MNGECFTVNDPKTGQPREVERVRFSVVDTETGDELAWARTLVSVELRDDDDLVSEAPRATGGRLRCTWLVEGTVATLRAQFCPTGSRTFVGEIDTVVERAAPPRWIAEQAVVEEIDTGALFASSQPGAP